MSVINDIIDFQKDVPELDMAAQKIIESVQHSLQQLKAKIAAFEPSKLLDLPREDALKILHEWRDLARQHSAV